MRRLFNNSIYQLKRGFSLIEVLVAASIFSVVALAIATVLIDSMQKSRFVSVTSDINEYSTLISTVFNNPLSCGASFLGQTVTTTGPFPSPAIPFTNIRHAAAGSTVTNPLPGTIIFKQPTPFTVSNSFIVQSMTLVTTGGSAPNYNASVNLTIQKLATNGIPGSNIVTKSFPLNLTISGASPIACSTTAVAAAPPGNTTVYQQTSPGCGAGIISLSSSCQTVYCIGGCAKGACFTGYYDCSGNCNQVSSVSCPNTLSGKISVGP